MSRMENRRVKSGEDAGSFASAVDHPRLAAALTSETSRLYSTGYSLVPLGGSDGKTPIVQFRNRARLPLALVIDKLAAAGSHTYGVRLQGLLVVDVDTDTPEARAYVEERFGTSPGRTKTSRGFHLWFRHHGPKPKPVRRPGIAIDFKSGQNEFVVGPQSQRPDGTIYLPQGRLPAPDHLPSFADRDADLRSQSGPVPERLPHGSRHTGLKKRAHQLALVAEDYDSLLADLLAFRNLELEDPEDFSDCRVTEMARWFWDKREKGELYGGDNSVVKIRRSALDALARRGEGVASLLHGIIQADHGHDPGAVFAIVPDGLLKSGRLKAGRRQIYAAIKVLLALDLIRCVKRPCGKRDHYLYQLGNGERLAKGERSKLILVSGKDTHFVPGDDVLGGTRAA